VYVGRSLPAVGYVSELFSSVHSSSAPANCHVTACALALLCFLDSHIVVLSLLPFLCTVCRSVFSSGNALRYVVPWDSDMRAYV
jgi:hypothetical protein